MSYNFKKINELELVAEVPDGANVLIETDGATRRVPSTAIVPPGVVLSVNDKTPDENGNVEVESVVSWNNLQDRPFGVDGDVTLIGGPAVSTPTMGTMIVSPAAVIESLPKIENGDNVYIEVDGIKYECSVEVTSGTDPLTSNPYTIYRFVPIGDHTVSGNFGNNTAAATNTLTGLSGTDPHTIAVYKNNTTVVCIDEKYIPDTIARTADVQTLIDEATAPASAVADAAGDTVTASEFNALLTALRNAGYLST